MSGVTEVDPQMLGDSDSEEDFTAMPELCDNERIVEEEGVKEVAKEAGGAMEAGGAKEAGGAPAPCVDEDGWEDVLGSGRLRKRVTSPGEGEERPARGSRVTVRVEERLGDEEGQVVQEEQEVQFSVGESEVVQCLDLVLPLMARGEVAQVMTDHSFAYGTRGDGDRVAPGSDLHLKVTLVSWRELGPAPDIPLEERAAIGNLKRERGNTWYSRGDYSLAVQCYRKAAEYLDDKQIEEDVEVPIDRFLLPKDIQELLENRVKTFNNMAQAQMKLNAFDSAMASVRQVLKIQPNNEKALFRKAKILQEKSHVEEAIGILRRINRLYPANKQCHAELSNLTNKLKASRSLEQNMSRKMLGLDKLTEASSSSFFSKRVQILLATLGGLGALAGGYMVRQYSMEAL